MHLRQGQRDPDSGQIYKKWQERGFDLSLGQIREYPEHNTEAYIRTLVQQCSRTMFIFCGSKRHIMTDMFFSPSKPFFQSVISQPLHPIPMDTYIEFAGKLFAQRGKLLDHITAEIVYRMFDGCTWYVQVMMNELFALTPEGGWDHLS